MKKRGSGFHGLLSCLLLISFYVPAGRAQENQDTKRKILKKEDVVYPPVLKSRGIGGTVQLRVKVKADGGVKNVQVLGGSPALADAAAESVRRWRFQAASSETEINVVVKFDPQS